MKTELPTLRVSEVYTAYQGEGPHIGYPVVFIRTQFCPVGCTWCDTKFTWDAKGGEERTVSSIVETVLASGRNRVVITGGEPLALPSKLLPLVDELLTHGIYVDFETSGAYSPLSKWNSQIKYVVSPKPPSAQAKIPTNTEAIKKFKEHHADFKFVVSNEQDLDWVQSFVAMHSLLPSQTYLMPCALNKAEHGENLEWLMERAQQRMPQVRITPRMHIAVYGAKRGT